MKIKTFPIRGWWSNIQTHFTPYSIITLFYSNRIPVNEFNKIILLKDLEILGKLKFNANNCLNLQV